MGRQLQGISGTGLATNYKYNVNGLRTEKTVNGQQHEYTYLGSKVTREIIRDAQGAILWTIHYSYAGGNSPVSMNVNGTEYYYLKNAQGDISHVVDADGNEVASYEYDAWGNHLSITGGELAELNPYRYRGYRYDSEAGLYYLRSRYYNPDWGRFINGDMLLGVGTMANMFRYCNNNPVNGFDPDGLVMRHITIDGADWFDTVPDITSEFNALLSRAEKLVRKIAKAKRAKNKLLHLGPFGGGLAVAVQAKRYLDFKDLVNHGQELDIKRPPNWAEQFDTPYNPTVKYNNQYYRPEDLGNMLYGYAGAAAGFSLLELNLGSGFAAFTSKPSRARWEWRHTYFDDPIDIDYIRVGYAMYHGGGK